MTLVDANKLALDDPVENYLPDFREQKDTNGPSSRFHDSTIDVAHFRSGP